MSPEPVIDGGLVVDKPSGPTSHDVVAIARRALRERRIGHTGTLDPLATGVLVLLVGRATRLAQFLVADEKEYIADVRLGISTPTYDADSRLTADGDDEAFRPKSSPCAFPLQADALERALSRFRGRFLQTPPPHSAKKIDGVRAYERARRHEPVDLRPVEVTVHALDMMAPDVPLTPQESRPSPLATDPSGTDTLLRLRIVCSSGFYVRSLAHDLGQALGCGAHLEALRRTRAGGFAVADAIPVEVLARDPDAARAHVLPPNALLPDLPGVTLTPEGATRAAHGNPLMPQHVAGRVAQAHTNGRVRLVDPSGALVAVAERRGGDLLHPVTVLV